MMFGCYRRDDANNPEVYVAAIAAVLADFLVEVIEYVTDPRTGIPRTSKWPPNPAEVAEACEARQRHLALLAESRPSRTSGPIGRGRIPPRPGGLANVFVEAVAPQHATMVARARDADPREWRWDERGRAGIWVALKWVGEPGKSRTRESPPVEKLLVEADAASTAERVTEELE